MFKIAKSGIFLVPKEMLRFRPSLMLNTWRNRYLNFEVCKISAFSCSLIHTRQFSAVQVVGDSRFYPQLKYKLNFFRIAQSSFKTGFNWETYTSSKIPSNFINKKHKRCGHLLSTETLMLKGQVQASSTLLKKKKVAATIGKLKENVLTIPNALCVARIIVTPFLGYLVIQEFYAASLSIFVLAGFTDVADGYIARTYPSQQSMIGSFLDPAADKILVATLFLSLTANGLIPIPLTSLIILRDVCLFSAGFYIRYVSLPSPKTLSRYFDVSLVTARLTPTSISKANTVIQLSLVAASLAAPVCGYINHFFLEMLWYVVGATTVLSGASYAYYNKDTYKLLALQKDRKITSKESSE